MVFGNLLGIINTTKNDGADTKTLAVAIQTQGDGFDSGPGRNNRGKVILSSGDVSV